MFRPSFLYLTALLLGLSSDVRADDPAVPASLIFPASDFPGLAGGFSVPRAGLYTIKVWTIGVPDWSIKTGELEGQTIILKPKTALSPSEPKWMTLGTVMLTPAKPTTIAIESPGSPQGPVPPFLSLSTDPDFTASKALDLIRGRVRSIDSPIDRRRTQIRTNQEGADFQPPTTPQAWRDRSRAVREQLLVSLGLWPMPPKSELNPRVVGTLERDGYAIDRVVLETLPGFYLAGNVYRPTGQPARRPLVLSPHGHAPEGRVNLDTQSRCVRLAQLGCVVFLYDMVGFADSKPFGHKFLNDRLRRWGLSLAMLQTWNSIRALDYMITRPDVDPARVAITGESGGATQTLLLTAIDDRIKVSAPVVMVSDSFQGGSPCENAAGLRHGLDNVEIAAMTAPRPLKIVGATGDWTARTMTNAFPTLLQVYGLVGTTDRVSADVFDFPHNYNQTSRDSVYAFLGKHFLGIDDLSSTREGKIKTEAPEDLYVFTKANPYPSDARTPDQLETQLVGLVGRQLDHLAPGGLEVTWEAARQKLSTALKIRVGVESPTPRESTSRVVRKVARDGLAITHHVVGRKGPGESIPVVQITPAHPKGRLTVLFTARGKADLSTPDGTPSPMARALLERGQIVVGFDPLLIGESFDPLDPSEHRPPSEYFDTYNRSLAADRAQDLATVLAWARSLPEVIEVSLVAESGVGPLALLARPALDGLARTAIDLGDFDFEDGSKPVPAGLDLPGALQFGGLKAASALTSPAPLWISRTGDSFATSWPLNSYALAQALKQLKIEKGAVASGSIARWIDAGE